MKYFLTFGFLSLAATTFGDNLVLNSDFSTGDLTNWSYNNWSVTPGSLAFGGAPAAFFASTGCAGSDCTSGGAFISQTLVTDPTATYTLSFDYNPDAYEASPEGPTELVVQFDGSTVIDLVLGLAPTESQTTAGTGFNTYTISGLTASTGSTVLEFFGREDLSADGLTNISVVDPLATPEPASYLMATVGFIALGVTKLRARSR